MITNFKDMGDHYLLKAKCGISNAPLQISPFVWAKNEEGRIHGLIVERGMGLLHQKRITNGRFVHHRQEN
jgi:glutaryl-CoA dehydrogenase